MEFDRGRGYRMFLELSRTVVGRRGDGGKPLTMGYVEIWKFVNDDVRQNKKQELGGGTGGGERGVGERGGRRSGFGVRV